MSALSRNGGGQALFLAVGMWAAAVAAALWGRPLLAVDETRYLAVAWEMWRDSEFLVPHLNGETYSHKPPLLFWMMHLGWAVIGVNEWWPRLVAPLFALAALLLTRLMARRLWPAAPEAHAAAPLILIGCVYWVLFATLTMFDMILAFCALLGLLGVLGAWRGEALKGFALFGLGIGLGVLAKGPAILLHVLPAALLAPLWGGRDAKPMSWGRWYGGVLAALVMEVLIALAWAVPAAVKGGEAYANAIFWGQSAGRMVDSFAHGRPWWWYLAVIGPMALPWALWPPLWRAARGLRTAAGDMGVRFCLAWFAPAFLVFSLISGKQLHYLLPVFPALALPAAFLLCAEQQRRPIDRLLPGLIFAALGAALLALPLIGEAARLPDWVSAAQSWWGLLPLLGGLAYAFVGRGTAALAALAAVLVVSVHLAGRPLLSAAYDLEPLAQRLAGWERQGYALAFFGKYHGQFHFLGRLEAPMQPIGLLAPDEEVWKQAHAKGKVVAFNKKVSERAEPDLVHRHRNGYFIVWDRQTVIDHPDIAERD